MQKIPMYVSLILLKLRSVFFFSPKVVLIKKHNFHIKIDPENKIVDEYIYAYNSWQPKLAKIICSELQKNQVFVDVGANIGYFSLLASRIVGQNGKVFAYEPISKISDQLTESVNLNQMQNIVVERKAIGNEIGVLRLEIMESNVGASSFVKNIKGNSYEDVEVACLDNLLANQERVDFLKIDVEGFEYQVLLGAESVIQKFHPKIIVEFSPTTFGGAEDVEPRKILEFAFKLGYDIYDIDNDCDVTNIDHFINSLSGMQTNLFLSK